MLVNQPFGGGGLLRKLSGRQLPDWAGEIGCTSWAQILLKFVLAHPGRDLRRSPAPASPSTCATMQAGLGDYPDAGLLQQMIETVGV